MPPGWLGHVGAQLDSILAPDRGRAQGAHLRAAGEIAALSLHAVASIAARNSASIRGISRKES